MLLGYVSDERYIALAGVEIEILGPGGSIAARSCASGSIHADIEPGHYEVILAKDGYGSKRVTVDLAAISRDHFRLLKDDLLGYAWPKWVTRGERASSASTATRPTRSISGATAGRRSWCGRSAGSTSTARGP